MNAKNKNFFVTGASGFLGKSFCKTAASSGHSVVALHRTPTREISRKTRSEMRIEQIVKPLSNIEPEDLKDIDAIIHFSAAGVSPQKTSWEAAFEHNVIDQLKLLNAAKDANVNRAIICGTCMEYGKTAENYERVPVSAELKPQGAYASSKAAACLCATAFAREHKIQLAYLRVFSVYGDQQHDVNFFPSLRTAAKKGIDFAMSPGKQVRDFTTVESVVSTFLDVATYRQLMPGIPEIHNVGSGHAQTLLEFATRWWLKWNATGKLIPGSTPYRPDEVMRYVPELTL